MEGRNVYMRAMQTVPAPQIDDLNSVNESRFVVRVALIGFGMMFIAAAIAWVTVGPGLFYDALAFAAACF
jgi:hypothetical protein